MKTERFYTVPLADAFEYPRHKRTPAALKVLRTFIIKHMKAVGMKVTISDTLNKFIWQRSIQKPPRRVKVRVVKEDSLVRVFLADEKEVVKEAAKPKEDKKEVKAATETKTPVKTEAKPPAAKTSVEKSEDAKKETYAKKETRDITREHSKDNLSAKKELK